MRTLHTINAEIDVPATFVAIVREEMSRGNVAFVDDMLEQAKRALVQGSELSVDLADAVMAVMVDRNGAVAPWCR